MAIGVALIGGGIWAKEEHLGYEDILKREDVQAVIISLPIANQVPFIRSALSAGKHVLSEKPVAENVADAVNLIKWTGSSSVNLPIFPHYQSMFEDADEPETSWRKNPTHQGGFLLDGGVHYTAALRGLLGPDVHFTRLAAFTTLLKEHLPPVDTMDAILKTNTGIQGTFQSSVATTLTGPEWTIACEKGTVTVVGSDVTVRPVDGEELVQTIADERTGVPPEIRAWGEALAAGRQNPEQTPEEALADLELIELMLRSGESEGQPQVCQHQALGQK
uniref:Gfo/Idh/MocA-like oxidoreductase N-terminal domain-containing protein n=1 Tax=Talaromyces marneffei PM1 TaxID=1077442 RepID=A0A093XFX8_TALMA